MKLLGLCALIKSKFVKVNFILSFMRIRFLRSMDSYESRTFITCL